MNNFPIGVIIDSFRMSKVEAIKRAAQMGVKGIQVYSTSGDMAPESLTPQKAKEFLKLVKDNGLHISALCGDLGEGFGKPERNKVNIERSKRILDLAKELDTNIVTTHIGVIPNDINHERYKIMQEACFELSQYADSLNAHFAIETGPETAAVLKTFLDSLNSRGVAVNLDPANLVMVTGDDPVQAVYTLKDYIVHTHAKDGRRLFIKDPEIVYGVIEEEIQSGHSFIELPLGEGDVDFKNYLKALTDIAYTGYLTIEREVGENPATDIECAVNFLNKMMGK